jgi:hypothetical protein
MTGLMNSSCFRLNRFFLGSWFLLVVLIVGGIFNRYQSDTQSWRVLRFGVEESWKGDAWRIQDFALLHDFSRAVLKGRVDHPYRLESQEKWNHEWVGPQVKAGVDFPYSPIFWVTYFPFLIWPTSIAYVIYCGFCLGFLAWVLLVTARKSCSIWPDYYWMSVACSISVCAAIGVGHSALWSTALMAMVWNTWVSKDRFESASEPSWKWGAFALFAVAAKPTLLIFCVFLLTGLRAWRSLKIGLIGVTLAFIAMTPLMGGVGWIIDYGYLLVGFNGQDMPAFFRQAMRPEVSTGLPSAVEALHLFPANLVSRVGLSVWFLGAGGLIMACWQGWVQRGKFFEGQAILYLLLCPHLNAAEDVLWLLLVLVCPFFQKTPSNPGKIVLLLLVMNGDRSYGLGSWPPLSGIPVAVLAKLALALWMTFLDEREKS